MLSSTSQISSSMSSASQSAVSAEQKENLQALKVLILDIVCRTETDDAAVVRATYSKFLDERIAATPDFNQARLMLLNQFQYHPICQGRIGHNNPLNSLCCDYRLFQNMKSKSSMFPLLQKFLNEPGVDANVFDAIVSFRDADDDRLAPLHKIMDWNRTLIADKNEVIIACVKELLAHGADINLKTTKSQCTPLHIAAEYCTPEVMEFLVTIPNIDLLARDSKGRSALEYARTGVILRKPEVADKVLAILEQAIKASHKKGVKRLYVRHVVKKTLLGSSETPAKRVENLAGRAVGAVVGDRLVGILGPMGR